jgi:hypothetical protein
MKKVSPSKTQLKFEFNEIKREQTKEVKVISLQKIQSNELNARILNRKRPSY